MNWSPLLQILESVLEPRSAAYAAGPLETCFELYQCKIVDTVGLKEMRAINQAKLTSFVGVLRKKLPIPVIDPGLLRCPGWTGTDYGDFFVAVLSKFAYEARFIDGWQYSSGATREFITCLQQDIACYDQQGNKLCCDAGFRLIRIAGADIERLGGDPMNVLSRLPEYAVDGSAEKS